MSTIYKRKNEQGTYIIDDDGFVIITYQDGSTERMAKDNFNQLFIVNEKDTNTVQANTDIEFTAFHPPIQMASVKTGEYVSTNDYIVIPQTDDDDTVPIFTSNSNFTLHYIEYQESTVTDDDIKDDDEEKDVETTIYIPTSTGTVIRTVSMMIVSIITLCNGFGIINPANADVDSIYNLIFSVVSVIIFIVCWWKNNSFSDAAKKADIMMKQMMDNDNNVNG